MNSQDKLRKIVEYDLISLPTSFLLRKPSVVFFRSLFPFLLLISIIPASIYVTSGSWQHISICFLLMLVSQRLFQTLVHDASHKFYSADIRINDYFADYLASGWIGSNINAYRKIHAKHHKFNGSNLDPEHISHTVIEEKGGLLIYMLRYIAMLESFRLFKKYYYNPSAKKNKNKHNKIINSLNFIYQKKHILLIQFLLTTIFIIFDVWYLYLLWLYIAMSWSPMLSGLRFLVEHPGNNELTRTTKSNIIEKAFFAPLSFNYHLEHHLWPQVPPYQLPKIHEFLSSNEFYIKHPEYINNTFIGALYKKW